MLDGKRGKYNFWTWKCLAICLMALLTVGLWSIPGVTYVELDADDNGYVDEDRGGTNLGSFAAALAAKLGAAYDTEAELLALFAAKENALTDEASLYATLSDVTQFYEAGDEDTIAAAITMGLDASDIDDQHAGTDITADLEEETHASEHAPNGADPIDAWYWGGALTVGDANPPVTNGYIYDCTGGTAITITDFFDSGDDDHSEFTDGDRIRVFANDSDVIFDFDGDPGTLEGNAGTNFTGHATQIVVLEFTYRNDVWYCDLSSGMTNGLTQSAKVGMNTVTDADGFTMTAAQGYNYTVYATGAGTIVMPPVAQYMQFCVENHTAGDVDLNPDATGTEDTIRLNGTALDIGDAIRGTDIGDCVVCTYYAADIWSCMGSGYGDEVD